MAKVIAIHEIVRPGEVIKPGQPFTSTGEELEQLKAAGAIKFGNSDAEDVEVKTMKSDDGGEGEGTQTPPAKAQTAAKGKAAKNDKDLV